MKKQKRSAAKASTRKVRAKARRSVARSSRVARAARPPKGRAQIQRSVKARLKAGSKPISRSAASSPVTPAQKAIRKLEPGAMQKALTRIAARTSVPSRTRTPHRLEASRPARPAPGVHGVNRQLLRITGAQQFNYMKAPGSDMGFDVGDTVEVFCDHERESERVRGWIKGVVVQVDNKLVAVQFRTNVFLTDGWMVPDRILWYSLSSDQIRAVNVGKKGARRPVPEY